MEALECMKTRTSIRAYKKNPVPEDVINRILEAAVSAPSAGNTQDWHFVVVRSPETKRQLSEAALNQEFIANSPVVIVACSDLERISRAYGERGVSLYSIQDTAAAAQNLMLAAWNEGLGSCWIGAFTEGEVKDILVLPTNVRPLAIITLGYPLVTPRKPGRRRLKDVVHFEKWETSVLKE